jgi:hypothetical protein
VGDVEGKSGIAASLTQREGKNNMDKRVAVVVGGVTAAGAIALLKPSSLSNLLKKASETAQGITQNIK